MMGEWAASADFTFARKSSTQPNTMRYPTLHCKQTTYQGIARVSKEKCRSIDCQALRERQLEAPATLGGSMKGLALDLTMLVSFI
jgi:hypothetical protein